MYIHKWKKASMQVDLTRRGTYSSVLLIYHCFTAILVFIFHSGQKQKHQSNILNTVYIKNVADVTDKEVDIRRSTVLRESRLCTYTSMKSVCECLW